MARSPPTEAPCSTVYNDTAHVIVDASRGFSGIVSEVTTAGENASLDGDG